MNMIWKLNKSIVAVLLSLLLCHGAFAAAEAGAAVVNINSASAEQIADSLKGIGLKKAQAIVAHRKRNGAFSSPEGLIAVKGIGESTVEKNRTRIRLK